MRCPTFALTLLAFIASATLLTATSLDKESVGIAGQVRMGKRRLVKTTPDAMHDVDTFVHSLFEEGVIEDTFWDASDLSMSMSMSLSMSFEMSFSMSMDDGTFDFGLTAFDPDVGGRTLTHSKLSSTSTAGGFTSTDSKLLMESVQSKSSAMKATASVVGPIIVVAASIAVGLL